MARPFKIRRFGHFGFNLERLDEAIEFYTEILGFRITDEASLFSQLKGRGLGQGAAGRIGSTHDLHQ